MISSTMRWPLLAACLLPNLCLPMLCGVLAAQDEAKPTGVYRVYVACESSDEVHRIAFDGKTAKIEKVIEVGYQATEVEGPHGLTVGPEGEYWYVSIAHGKPFGLLYKYRTDNDELVGECELGMFPATMQISPATGLLYCVNFNLHGRMLPSTVSIVDPDAMVEVARTVTGAMPHGSRLSKDGRFHYSCAMMSGEMYEIDAVTFAVNRNMQLDINLPKDHASEAKPTWVSPHPDGKHVYAALNGKATIVEVDTKRWAVSRRFPTGKGPYNLDITADGKTLVATYKTEGAIGIWDLADRSETNGKELARIKSTRGVTHGVVISPDGRYAFVTSEGKNSERGAVDIIDLRSRKIVATAEVSLQAGGIAFYEHADK
ncbi:MAG: DNA-binding beta-propeller fold protein YncE [Hyphomicrobiaceae bacterium]|jgi:DNA-binding beta-propeller fold protein YncE